MKIVVSVYVSPNYVSFICDAVIDVESANCCGATVQLQTVSRVRLALFGRVSK